MELYQLRTFVAVAAAGHLTRAAERLHLSQPAVSAHVKALEEELQVRLFERAPGGMVLTPVGRKLREQAEEVLHAADELKHLAAGLKGEVAGRLRIGTSSDPEFIRVGRFLSVAVAKYPLLELELHHEVSGLAFEAVRDGSLDASFFFGDITDPEVAGLRLSEMAYRVVAPAAWCDRVRGADWAEVAAMPWILTPPTSTHSGLVRALFREHGVEPSRHVEADQEAVIITLITSGVGVSLMRESLALEKERAGQVCIWDRARLETTLWFIYQRERAHDPLIEALLDVLAGVWREAGPKARSSVGA